ncbi:DUF6489 family protein [Temperatibacter marinus]|uniref:DUF6489 family protein n=1 Tax=Temperatibacter marinus TaxID=1456591 RepID=A0AA52EJH6_9PROT|nr:DUF6489 family protein [Temperatibacter marinus]WND03672.1 DUF6489 family protein [Temperatibacter marinus]
MEIKITIDCTPEEARRMMGLPDVTPLNEALIDKMKERMEDGFDVSNLDSLMKSWTEGATGASQNMADFQKMFLGMLGGQKD